MEGLGGGRPVLGRHSRGLGLGFREREALMEQWVVDQATGTSNALRIAVALLKEQAQYECYVMCDCDDKAKKALQEMADALSVTPEYLEKM
jgi:hypothetical protein